MEDLVVRHDAKEDAYAIRTKVFVEEQGYEDEFDDIDDCADHIVVFKGGKAAGCARCFPEEESSACYIVGRVATLPEFRGCGIGRLLVEECEVVAQRRGACEMKLHAQARLEGWYASMGYGRTGEVDYEDEGQPHIWMKKVFSDKISSKTKSDKTSSM